MEGSGLLQRVLGNPGCDTVGQTKTKRKTARTAPLVPKGTWWAFQYPLHWLEEERGPGQHSTGPCWTWVPLCDVDVLGWGWKES